MNPNILELQAKLQRESFGYDLENMTDDEMIEYLRWNYIALVQELGEALDECAWKPWVSSIYINRMEFLKELIDAAHFFNNMWLVVAGLDPAKSAALFTQLYEAKHEVNAKRQEEGYDGVSGKCSTCRRDIATTAKKAITSDGQELLYCPCGRVLGIDHG